ncbi:hypothetical protein BC628DRAFT_1342880 [Trametes gibbosa]|nr:hypothetical protein BC628DRAFT_1342880 [Trametes gibbosa]
MYTSSRRPEPLPPGSSNARTERLNSQGFVHNPQVQSSVSDQTTSRESRIKSPAPHGPHPPGVSTLDAPRRPSVGDDRSAAVSQCQ